MKKTERKKLEDRADKLWSKCVRTKDRVCRNCGSDENLQAHHCAGRVYKPTKYLLVNGVCLCSRCHFPEKVRPEEFRSMVIGIVGQEHYDLMHQLAKGNGQPYKVTIADLEITVESLTRELKRLEGDWGRLQTNM